MSQNRFYVDSVYNQFRAAADVSHLDHVDPHEIEAAQKEWLGALGTRKFGCHYRAPPDFNVASSYLPRYLDHRLMTHRPNCGYESFHPLSELIHAPDGDPRFKRYPANTLCSGYNFSHGGMSSIFRMSGCHNAMAQHGFSKNLDAERGGGFRRMPEQISDRPDKINVWSGLLFKHQEHKIVSRAKHSLAKAKARVKTKSVGLLAKRHAESEGTFFPTPTLLRSKSEEKVFSKTVDNERRGQFLLENHPTLYEESYQRGASVERFPKKELGLGALSFSTYNINSMPPSPTGPGGN